MKWQLEATKRARKEMREIMRRAVSEIAESLLSELLAGDLHLIA